MTELIDLLRTSSHTTFKRLLQPLLTPSLQHILSSAQQCIPDPAPAAAIKESTAPSAKTEKLNDVQQRGQAWAMLGMLRLHLTAPPAGADPVGKYAYKKAHMQRMLEEDVLPETQVSLQHNVSTDVPNLVFQVTKVLSDSPMLLLAVSDGDSASVARMLIQMLQCLTRQQSWELHRLLIADSHVAAVSLA